MLFITQQATGCKVLLSRFAHLGGAPAMNRMLEPGPNPHIQKFMERKAPKGYGTPRVNTKRAEEDSGICYPKDTLRETILLKNTPMRMACKLPGEVPPKPEAPDCHGRAKSDITTGHENLYERSYYS